MYGTYSLLGRVETKRDKKKDERRNVTAISAEPSYAGAALTQRLVSAALA